MGNLKIEDLIEGEIYYTINPSNNKYIFKSRESKTSKYSDRLISDGSFNRNDYFGTGGIIERNLRKATSEEKHWLNCCIEKNEFVPYEKAMETFNNETFAIEVNSQEELNACVKFYNNYKQHDLKIFHYKYYTVYPKEKECQLLISNMNYPVKTLKELGINQQNTQQYEVVHCQTKQEWDFVREKTTKVNSQEWEQAVTQYPEGIALSSEGLGWCGLNYFKQENSLIYSFNEWCNKFGHSPDFMNKKQELSLLEQAAIKYPIGCLYKGRYEGSKTLYTEIAQKEPMFRNGNIEVGCGYVYLVKENWWAEVVQEIPKQEIPEYVECINSETIEIGDEVRCVNSGKSVGLGEIYEKGNKYIVSHLFLEDKLPTIGLQGYSNICKAKDFILVKKKDVVSSICIW